MPASHPTHSLCRFLRIVEEAAVWQGEFSRPTAHAIAEQVLRGLRCGGVTLPDVEVMSTGKAITQLRWLRENPFGVLPGGATVPFSALAYEEADQDALKVSAEFEGQIALSNQQPLLMAIVDAVLDSPDGNPGELVDVLRPVCDLLRVSPDQVADRLAGIGYSRLKERWRASSSLVRDKQQNQLRWLLREVDSITGSDDATDSDETAKMPAM